MGKIKTIPSELISRIAAGEVIERPAYAIKELIENSIDAKADFIKIDVEQSGLKKILVIDNGEGMDEDDLKNSFLPHTTSKLQNNSLSDIQTFGFRGEALSSIASISNLTIISRLAPNPLGYQVKISLGKLIKDSPAGSPVGTTVLIENLFENVQARKKVLKTSRTEFRHILEIITQYALSYPNIQFEFLHNKRLILSQTKNETIPDRIKSLLGLTIYHNLLPIQYEDSYLKISGFLSRPQISSNSSRHQYIFINDRRIDDLMITSAVKEAYGNMIEKTSYPVFILFIQIPGELVDVNVHPRKEQVRFYNNQFIYDAVVKAVNQVLSEHNLTFTNLSWVDSIGARSLYSFEKDTNSYIGNLLKEESLTWQDSLIGKTEAFSNPIQIHNLYLIIQTKRGIAIIDQHAAHERVLYEKFLKAFKEHKKEKQTYRLEKALLFELPLLDAQALKTNLETLSQLGFIIVEFGNNSFKIEAVPLIFKDRDIHTVVLEIIEDLNQNHTLKDIDIQSQKMINYLACRSAIKAGENLSKKQIKELLEQIEEFDGIYTCPHGRPLKIEIPLSQLDKLFKRS